MNIKLPPFTKNFYFIVGLVFLFWMLFIDGNDFITQIRLKNKLRNLQKEKEFYLERIQQVEVEREQLFTNQEMLEKYARENYLMRKDNEDLFVIVEE
ncbi:MAG: septum formation initiator family protein [Cyclobacteriaceae bacterium]